MFDNIKKRIAAETENIVKPNVSDDSAVIAEYAHLFQELDDLSLEGEEDDSKSIDILLDDDGNIDIDDPDDIEIEELGYNLSTGQISVLSDAAIKTEYATMKSKDDFVMESDNLLEFENEDVDSYESRKAKYADKEWMRYRQKVLQEGSFGYKRVNSTADSVPSFVSIDFGDDNGKPYHLRMEVHNQVDRKGNLTRHQLESIYLAESCGLCKNLMNKVKEDICDRYHISESANIWDTLVPTLFATPVDPIDKHSVIVGFKNNANLSNMEFYRFTNPVCEYATNDTVLEHADVERLDPEAIKEFSKFCISKNMAIKESMKDEPHYHRYVQEAINIGGDDSSNNNADTNSDQNADANNNTTDNNTDANTNTGDNTNGTNDTNNAQQDDMKTVEVGKNDVSDAIVQGAEDATTNNTEPSEGQDATTDLPDNDMPTLDDTSTDTTDTTTDDTSSDEGSNDDMSNIDVDSTLNELNNEGSEGDAIGDGSLNADEVDINNMSIDDLLKQGTEALKSMSIEQLKEFLANNDAKAVTEAFVLTNANINDEVDILLKKTLGVLNDNKLDIHTLVSEFKKYGKKLNRVLTKASKSPKVYNANEIDNIKKLNKCLTDLMVTIKATGDTNVIKRLMKAFTSQAALVGKIIEKKKKELPKPVVKETKKSVQESYGTRMTNFLDSFND